MSICRVLGSLALIASISGAAYAAQPDRVLGPVTGTGSLTLPGTVHRKALPRFDQGPVAPDLRFGSVMLLTTPTLSQQRALNQLLAEQQDPSSPNYHRWLTPEQWADRFGLSQNDLQRITTWLKSQGFTVEYVARGRNWISFSGTAVQIESAFGTAIHSFNVNGELHVANAVPVKIPLALNGIVTGVRGLNDFHPHPRARVRPNFFDAHFNSQFVAPGDIATLYNISPLYTAGIDGSNQKVAVAGQTDIFLADINDFRTGFGLSSISCTTTTTGTIGIITSCSDPHFKYVVPTGLTDPGSASAGDLGEADLDIEMAGAVARGAQIIYVNAPVSGASGGVWAAWYYAVDNNVAPVISLSYGTCEFGDNDVLVPSTGADGADETELKKANTEGITFVNSSGDSGAAECDPTQGGTDPHGASATQGIAVAYPASSPEVTGVGGTATPLNAFGSPYWGQTNGSSGGSALEYAPEQAWNDDNEIAQFCTQNASNSFCKQGGSTKVTGWVPITNAKIAQQDLALLGDGISSTGGGASNCAKQTSNFAACVSGFPQPSWQKVTVSGQSPVRFSPDISFLASPNFPGYIFCTRLSEFGISGGGGSCDQGIQNAVDTYLSIIGGTSASAPLFAGAVALLNQYTGSSGQGNINPSLYSLAAVAPNAFHDVSGADNKVYCTAGTPSFQPAPMRCPSSGVLGFTAGSGYDLATGLGSLDVNAFAVALKSPPDFSASSDFASSVSVQSGQTATGHITITAANNFSGSVSFSTSGLPSGTTVTFNPTTVTPPTTTQTVATITGGASTSSPANVTITATTGSLTQMSHQAASLSLSVSDAFSLQPTAASFAVPQGSNVDATVQVTLNPPFAGTITFTCSDPAPSSTCTPPPNTNASGQVSFHITTALPTAKLQPPIRHEQRIFFAALLPGLLGIFFTVGSGKRRAAQLLGLILVLGASTLWMASCGGNGGGGNPGNPGTPKGQYTIKVTGTSGGASVSSQFTLNVQ